MVARGMRVWSMRVGVAAAIVAAVGTTGCKSDAPKPLEAKNVSAPLTPPPGYLPPGLATSLKPNDAVSIKVPLKLLQGPKPGAIVAEKLPAGTLVKLKTRILNDAGPWWLVETPHAAGWVPEHELLRL